MLRISMKYDKRICICRLKGNLNKNTSNKLEFYLESILNQNNINYIVLNINNLSNIDEYGNHSLLRIKDKYKTLILNNNLLNNRLVALDILNING